MPASINDYDKNDEDSGGLSEGFTPAQSSSVGSSNGPKEATPTKQQDDSYVPWSSFVSANQDVSQREAGKLAGQVQGEVTKAQGDLSSAQSGFNNGIDSNYSTPAAKGSSSSSSNSTPAPSKSAPAAGAEQSQAPATSATDAWAGLSTPSTPATQRTPVAKGAPTGAAVDGSNPFANSTPQSRTPQPTTPQAPLGNRVTSQNPTQAATFPTVQQPQPSFGGSVAATSPQLAPARTAAVAPTNPGAQGLLGFQRSQQLGANVAANGAQGPHDLEASAGQAGWDQLLADTKKAQEAAANLGNETGVQALLQKNASSPTNSAFDAALINGQGASQFRDLANKYGGSQLQQGVINAEQASQDRWNQLAGDVKTRQAFDAAGKGQPAPTAAQDSSGNPTSQQSNNATLGITQTSGANGQFDSSGFPPNFDPSSDPAYQSAAAALAQAAPVPSWADNVQDLLSSEQATRVWPEWAKELGVTEDQLTGIVKAMPDWEFQLFIRGVVPASLDRSNGQGYFEGLLPVQVGASGAGTDPKYKAAMDAFGAVMTSIVSLGYGGSAGISGGNAVATAIAQDQDKSGAGVNRAAEYTDKNKR